MSDDKREQIGPLEPDQWTPELQYICAEMNGSPINVHKLMSHSPGLLQAWWSFRNYAVSGGALGQRLGELVILRVGVHLAAWYEWASHVDRATRIGMEPKVIFETLNRHPSLPKEEVLILQAVDQLMVGHRIEKSTRSELEKYFTTAQLMDLIAIQGMYVILGGFINTWTLELDGVVAQRIAKLTNQRDFEAAAAKFKHAITQS